jgi:uncharacterized protein YndB with AHSA1/START domain
MQHNEAPVAVAEMLIRKPVAEVYEAFIDPAITSKFWFSHGSARLDSGGPVRWEWRMYGFDMPVTVRELVKDRKIVLDWNEPPTSVEWTFTPMERGTFVSIRNSGFPGDAAEQAKQAVDSAGGFSFVLAGCKAWLEHGVELKLVEDRHPRGLPSTG